MVIRPTQPSAFTNATSPEQPFPLMKLPREVRDLGYKEHLVFPDVFVTGERKFINPPPGNGHWGVSKSVKLRSWNTALFGGGNPFAQSVCNLFATSKIVYLEAIPVFFRLNDFRFDTVDHLHIFLSSIGTEARRKITSISFAYEGHAPAKAIKLLKECIRLRRLSIELTRFTNNIARYPHCLAKSLGIRELLKLRGIRELDGQ